MVKIAHVCTTRLMYKLLQDKLILLSKEGYKIDIISARDYKEINIFNNNGISQKYVEMSREINLMKDIISIFKMVKLFKVENYTIIHTHNAKAGLIGRIAAKFAGVPVVIHTTHGLPFFEGQSRIKYNIFKILELFGLKFCDKFGSQNREDLNIMMRYVPDDKLFYEGNGIDKSKMDDIYNDITDEKLMDLRMKLNIPKDNNIFLMGARFEPVKNHKLLMEALNKLKNNGIRNFSCLLAGQGELEEEIKNSIEKYGLKENIIFLGYKTDIYKYIKLSDIVILTSFKEGIPRILMESMYFKKPVIATDVLGTRELVVNNETGLLSTPTDSEALFENIKLLFNDCDLRSEFGINGRKRIIERFTEQIVVKRLDNIYKELIDKKIII